MALAGAGSNSQYSTFPGVQLMMAAQKKSFPGHLSCGCKLLLSHQGCADPTQPKNRSSSFIPYAMS